MAHQNKLIYSVEEFRKKKKFAKIKDVLKYFFGEKPTLYWRYALDRKAMRKALKKVPGEKQIQFPTRVAIIYFCGGKYIRLLPKFYETVKKYFLPNTPKDFFIFTDKTEDPFLLGKKDMEIVPIKFETWPFITLKKFKSINRKEKELKKYSHIIFLDGDTYIKETIPENEFFSHDKPFFGVQHPYFVKKKGLFEKNPISTAAVKEGEDLSIYWQGCFFGAKAEEFIKMSKEMEKRIDKDLKKNFVANWNDEPHIIKYFIENKDKVFTFNPAYSYPEGMPIQKPFRKKIIHACKVSKEMQI